MAALCAASQLTSSSRTSAGNTSCGSPRMADLMDARTGSIRKPSRRRDRESRSFRFNSWEPLSIRSTSALSATSLAAFCFSDGLARGVKSPDTSRLARRAARSSRRFSADAKS
eukprot:7380539-Prymnesium_polylepis.1